MLGSLNVAERRLTALMDKYGADFVMQAAQELQDYSERLMREEIRAIPPGEYSFEEFMEDDGITDRRYRIQTTVVVRDGEVLVDYTGTDPQAQGPINATYGVTASATYNAMLQITGAHIPRNAGCYRPIKIIAPPGSLVNVQYPGPSVGGNTETQPRIVGSILGALGQVLPEQVMAAEGATSCNFLFGGVSPRTGRYYTHYHFEASGWGGRYRTDGNSAQNHIHGNCRNTPVEIFESIFPFLVESYGLRPDSGGAGRRRGGLGTRRVLKVLAPSVTVSLMMDHVKQGAWGAFGGESGGLAGMWVKKKGAAEFKTFSEVYGTTSPSKFANIILEAGDELMLDSAGGGGYGPPAEREPELVMQDIQDGFVTPAAARETYGVKLSELEPETAAAGSVSAQVSVKG
jgi:N-methylhydantoinase B/oxoprolinase/acetone carboxylase alpha subunit